MNNIEALTVPGLDACVERLAPLHRQLCPRQVLGARMGLFAGTLLGLDLPQVDKRLLTFVETDGCFADGVQVATGCRVGGRTLRVVEYGKIAATFVDTQTGRGYRMSPHPDARETALAFAPAAPSRWHAQCAGYGVMPVDRLLQVVPVVLAAPLAAVLGEEDSRVRCSRCCEEVIDQREVVVDGQPVCRGCTAPSYYQLEERKAN